MNTDKSPPCGRRQEHVGLGFRKLFSRKSQRWQRRCKGKVLITLGDVRFASRMALWGLLGTPKSQSPEP